MISKHDRVYTRTAAMLEQKQGFGKKISAVSGNASDAMRAATEAKNAVDSLAGYVDGMFATTAKAYQVSGHLSQQGWYRVGVLASVYSCSAARVVIGGQYVNDLPNITIVDLGRNHNNGYIIKALGSAEIAQVSQIRLCSVESGTAIDIYYSPNSANTVCVNVLENMGAFTPENLTNVTDSTELVLAEASLTV